MDENILQDTYHKRDLFSTLHGYTYHDLRISRLSVLEQNNLKMISNLITTWVRNKIRYHDFDMLLLVGSTLYSEQYRADLQSRVDPINTNKLNEPGKDSYLKRNMSSERIIKTDLQNTINQKGNDIDIILTGFSWWSTSLWYSSFYKEYIHQSIQTDYQNWYLRLWLDQFLSKKLLLEELLLLVKVDDINWFKEIMKSENSYENISSIIKNYKIKLSDEWVKQIPTITSNHMLKYFLIKSPIVSKEDYIRDTYLQTIIPGILKEHNIQYSHEELRDDWSSYGIFAGDQQSIIKFKHINPNKSWCLIIQFPDCRPIHLDITSKTINDIYFNEKKYDRPFSLLFSNYFERGIFLETSNKDNFISSNDSLEEQIWYVRSKKQKIKLRDISWVKEPVSNSLVEWELPF